MYEELTCPPPRGSSGPHTPGTRFRTSEDSSTLPGPPNTEGLARSGRVCRARK